MKIQIPGYVVELREAGAKIHVISACGNWFFPTVYQGPISEDPPTIARIRKQFFGKPDTPETAFAIAKALMGPQWREARPGDEGKPARFSNGGSSHWISGTYGGMVPRHEDNNGRLFLFAEVQDQ